MNAPRMSLGEDQPLCTIAASREATDGSYKDLAMQSSGNGMTHMPSSCTGATLCSFTRVSTSRSQRINCSLSPA